MPQRVHVIDDDEAARESLAFLLETHGFDVAVYESGVRFVEAYAGDEHGVVVTDVRMPGMSGLELVERLHERGARIPIIVITGHGDIRMAVEAMRAGVHDFIEKPFDGHAIVESIKAALCRSEIAAEKDGERTELLRRIEKLSTREHQVLAALVNGASNKEVARELGISPRTIEIYRANVMTKMQATSLSELVRMALAVGS